MNIWHDFPAERISPEKFISVIEIPKGSKRSMRSTRRQG